MECRFRKKFRKSNGVKFIFYPIAFFLLTVFLIAIAFGPVVMPYVNMMDLAFTSSTPQFDENAANIYQGPVQNTGDTLKSSDIKFPSEGETFGELHIPSVGIDAPIIYGDNIKNMINGVELYSGTYLPGQGHTILIGGHNNTYFLPLPNVNVGDQVELCTNYGTYLYEITGLQTTQYDDTTAYDLTKQEENLILYTCHNIAEIGATPYRVFVYAQYVSGPEILS